MNTTWQAICDDLMDPWECAFWAGDRLLCQGDARSSTETPLPDCSIVTHAFMGRAAYENFKAFARARGEQQEPS